jgi:hypothetical protein
MARLRISLTMAVAGTASSAALIAGLWVLNLSGALPATPASDTHGPAIDLFIGPGPQAASGSLGTDVFKTFS